MGAEKDSDDPGLRQSTKFLGFSACDPSGWAREHSLGGGGHTRQECLDACKPQADCRYAVYFGETGPAFFVLFCTSDRRSFSISSSARFLKGVALRTQKAGPPRAHQRARGAAPASRAVNEDGAFAKGAFAKAPFPKGAFARVHFRERHSLYLCIQ